MHLLPISSFEQYLRLSLPQPSKGRLRVLILLSEFFFSLSFFEKGSYVVAQPGLELDM